MLSHPSRVMTPVQWKSPSGGSRVQNTRAKPSLQVWKRGDTSDFSTTTCPIWYWSSPSWVRPRKTNFPPETSMVSWSLIIAHAHVMTPLTWRVTLKIIFNSGLQMPHRPLHNKGGWFARRQIWIQGDDAILQGEIWFHRSGSLCIL